MGSNITKGISTGGEHPSFTAVKNHAGWGVKENLVGILGMIKHKERRA